MGLEDKIWQNKDTGMEYSDDNLPLSNEAYYKKILEEEVKWQKRN